MHLSYVLLLSIAAGLDSLFAGVAYGLKSIQIPLRSLAVVGLITALGTTLSMVGAHLLGKFIDSRFTLAAAASLLVAIGLFNLLRVYLTHGAAPRETNRTDRARRLIFSIGGLVISIMAKPENADLDDSKSISPGEAVLLSLALGVDNMVVTFAAHLASSLPPYTPLLMGGIQMSFVKLGD
jgi:putative sporulation protein YtaF